MFDYRRNKKIIRKTPVSEIVFTDLEYLFKGSGVYGGKLHSNMMALTKNKDFLQAITENIKTLGLFSTYAGSPDSSKKAINDFKQALPTDTQTNLEEFYCKGTLFKIFGMGRPVAKDLEKGRMWAKQIVSR